MVGVPNKNLPAKARTRVPDRSSRPVVSRARLPLRHDPPTARRPMRRSDTNFVKMLKLTGTWSWVKLVSVPESPPIGLYDTVSVQPHRLLHVKCCAFLIFNWTEQGSCRAGGSHHMRGGVALPGCVNEGMERPTAPLPGVRPEQPTYMYQQLRSRRRSCP